MWLSRFQPVFAALAVGLLAYQGWLVWRRPRRARTRQMLLILWTSVGTNIAIGAGLLVLWLRYR